MTQRVLNMHAQLASDMEQRRYRDAPINWVLSDELLPAAQKDWSDVGELEKMFPEQVHVTMKNNCAWTMVIEWPMERVSRHTYSLETRRFYNWIPSLHPSLLRMYNAGMPEQLNDWSPLEHLRTEKSQSRVREAQEHVLQSDEGKAGLRYEEGMVPVMGLHEQHDP